MELLLAHLTATPHGDNLAMTILFVIVIVVPFVVLGVVSWIFWKAKRREDAEREARERLEWHDARSS